MWQTKSKKLVYEDRYTGQIFCHSVRLPNNIDAEYFVTEPWESHFPVVIPVQGDEIFMIKQYRYAIGREALEFVMGTVRGKSLFEMAAIELQEETGIAAGKLEELGSFYPVPSRINAQGTVFLATDLTFGQSSPEVTEIIELQRIKIKDLDNLVTEGKIIDGNTLSALIIFKNKRKNL